ncbi:hypothetical protein Glove_104g22 [Diversispora epigaea]|uniref:Transmembrane protein n=1 Tax=Diversispora epigaea TaxID=1348612 RepID=A0A397J6R6_9GLOM|nr:hypothetical protein Glove_104g22 [Diversispora epigaea]
MTILELKQRMKNVFARFTESKWIQIFILTSIFQAIIIIALEVRVYLRNVEAGYLVSDLKNLLIGNTMGNNASMPNCLVDPSIVRMQNIESENIIFIIFQLFQILFSLNAVYNKNTNQVVIITTINFICAIYGILQWLEVKKWYNDLSDACPNRKIHFGARFFGYDLPLLISLLLFAFIMSLICYQLYHIYGWFTYKTIGADVKIQRVFMTYTRFIMLLKLDWFFMFGFAIESCKIYVDRMQDLSDVKHVRYLPRPFFIFNMIVTAGIFVFQFFAYYSVKKEWKIGSYMSCAFWIICIIDFCILLYYSIGSVKDSWYFFIIYDIVAVIFASLTIIWNILVILNFGCEIQDKIDQKEKRISLYSPHDESGEKFTIDD